MRMRFLHSARERGFSNPRRSQGSHRLQVFLEARMPAIPCWNSRAPPSPS